MTPISRGLGGRRRDDVDPSRIPPGQGATAAFYTTELETLNPREGSRSPGSLSSIIEPLHSRGCAPRRARS